MQSGAAKRVLPIVFSLAMGLIGLSFAHSWRMRQIQALRQKEQQLKANYQEPIQVVVAAKDVAEGTALEPAMLTMASVPQKFVQPYSIQSPMEVAGMVATAPIAEGEQVMTNKLRRPEAVSKDATLSSVTPKGKRAVTIAVDTITGVGGFVRPGDSVDVLWTFKIPGVDQASTMTMFQDVPVLAMGPEIVGRAGPQTPDAGSASMAQYIVTLALNPQETSALLFAREQGRIQLSLRPPKESGVVPVPPMTLETLAQMMQAQAGSSAEAAAAPKMRQVEVYKGLKRDVVVLADEQPVP